MSKLTKTMVDQFQCRDEPVTTEALCDPADVTHLYKPGGVVFATRIRY